MAASCNASFDIGAFAAGWNRIVGARGELELTCCKGNKFTKEKLHPGIKAVRLTGRC
jgi:hypothetical protein